MIHFHMPMPLSVNSAYINTATGRARSAKYNRYVFEAVTEIRQQRPGHTPGHVFIIFGVERLSKLSDIDNRLKTMLDCVVKANVIDDDRFVTAIAISWMPKATGKAWVRIIPMGETDVQLTLKSTDNGAYAGFYTEE